MGGVGFFVVVIIPVWNLTVSQIHYRACPDHVTDALASLARTKFNSSHISLNSSNQLTETVPEEGLLLMHITKERLRSAACDFNQIQPRL